MSLLQRHVINHAFPDMCHVCGDPLRACDSAVVHDGYVRLNQHDISSNGTIGLHIECATILSMRLIADVMDHKGGEHEHRVVYSLSKIRNETQKEF